jgi:hypothetical protein
MSNCSTSVMVPAPLAQVVPAAVYAANALGMRVEGQSPYGMKCKGGITFTTYPVTVELSVAGVDGAAQIAVRASNFGFGPLQSRACRDKATELINRTCGILQSWAAQQGAQNAPPPAPGQGR